MAEPDSELPYRSRLARLLETHVPRWSGWVILSLLVGAGILAVRFQWSTAGLSDRLARDLLLFVAVPLGLGVLYGKNVGWTVNREAIADAAALTAFVLPFYVVGSTLPAVRGFYPMWPTSPALDVFVPHAIQLFLVVLATETYYRGLLCVGLREIGFKCVFVNPVVYALVHAGKPPIELALAAPAGLLFGAVDYRSGSVLPSTVAHGTGLVALEWLVLHEPIGWLDPVDRLLVWLSVLV